VSAREELLATGRIGEVGAAMLYEVVGLVGPGYRFPPPDGFATWDESAGQSVAHDFLEHPRTPKRLLDIAIRSVDEHSFELQLEKAVANYLRDIARSTDLGKLIVRVKQILRSTPEFITVGRAGEELWSMQGLPTQPTTIHPDVLAAAIRREEVVVPKWTSTTRDAPLADRETYVRLIRLVLTAARGSLTASETARILATRFDHRHVPLTVELDATDGLGEPIDPSSDPGAETASMMTATEVFDGLSDRERIVVANLDLTVRDLAKLVGTGKSQASELRQRLLDRLTTVLDEDEDLQGTVAALIELCDRWLDERRTNGTGGTSN
jgi:hypothetical protein